MAEISGGELLERVYSLMKEYHQPTPYVLEVALPTGPSHFQRETHTPLHYHSFDLFRFSPRRSWLLGLGKTEDPHAIYHSDILSVEIAAPQAFTLDAWRSAVGRCQYLQQSLLAAQNSGALVFPSPGSAHLARLVEAELIHATRTTRGAAQVRYEDHFTEVLTEKFLDYLKGH